MGNHWEKQQGQATEEGRTPRPEAAIQPHKSAHGSAERWGQHQESSPNEHDTTPARQATH